MSSDSRPQLSDLLEHRAFLQRFARGLTRDAGIADDVVQETWLEALERPPHHRANLRGWLRRVALNAFRQRKRSRTAALPLDELETERTEPPDVSIERESVSRALSAELLALPDPYRHVLILRYFEDKTPTEIAAELGRPLNTVTSQLGRGLKLMHERLDRSQPGGRARWLPALGLLTPETAPDLQPSGRGDRRVLTTTSGARIFAWLGVTATAVVSVVLLLRASERAAPAVAPAEPVVAERDSLLEAPPPADGRQALPVPPSAAIVPPETAGPPEVASAGARLLVQVISTDGQPIPGANVQLARYVPVPGDELMMHFEGENPTDGSGRVEIPATEENRVQMDETNLPQLGVMAVADGYVLSDKYALPFPESGVTSLTIRLEPNAAAVRGRVTDPSGAPIEGAFVSMGRAHTEWIDLGQGRSRSVKPSYERTGSDGSFAHEALPHGELRVHVIAQGFVSHVGSIRLSASSTLLHDVVLQRGATIAGRVETSDGLAVEGARVWAEFYRGEGRTIQEGLTDMDGRFELGGIVPGTVLLMAQHETLVDHIAARQLRVGEEGERALTLVLEERPPLRLRIQREDGSPLGGIPVAAYPARMDQEWQRYDFADENGRLTLEALPDDDVIVAVFQTHTDKNTEVPPCYLQTGLSFGPEHTLTVPSERLRRGGFHGILLDHEGHPFPNARMYLRVPGEYGLHNIHVEKTGAFRNDPLPAQTYQLIAVCRMGTWVIGPVDVPGEMLDLGEIVLPPPVVWSPQWPDPRAPSADAYELRKYDRLEDVEKAWMVAQGVAPPPPSFSLLPGRYEWRLSGGGKTLLSEQIDLR